MRIFWSRFIQPENCLKQYNLGIVQFKTNCYRLSVFILPFIRCVLLCCDPHLKRISTEIQKIHRPDINKKSTTNNEIKIFFTSVV